MGKTGEIDMSAIKLLAALTEAEKAILQQLADGRRHGEIASILAVSTGVIDQRVHIVKNKIGAATTTGAVAMALRHGIIK